MENTCGAEDLWTQVEDLPKRVVSRCRIPAALTGLEREDLLQELAMAGWMACLHWRPDGGLDCRGYAALAMRHRLSELARSARARKRAGPPALSLDEAEKHGRLPAGSSAQDNLDLRLTVEDRVRDMPPERRELFRYLAAGYTQKEIARRLHRAQSTVCAKVGDLRTDLRKAAGLPA